MAQEDAVVAATATSLEAMVLEECSTSIAVIPDSRSSMEPNNKAAATTLFSDHVPSSPYFSARIHSLSEQRSNFANEVDFEIECSRSHWTERSLWTSDSEDGRERMSNSDVFERLKEYAEWGMFFRRSRYDLEMGGKIAEGGQAEIFAASGTNLRDGKKRDLVVKVFKEGYSLVDLQRLWPPGLANAALPYRYFPGIHGNRRLCWAMDVQLLKGDRFTFVFERHWGDLRKWIDLRMLGRNGAPPFSFLTNLQILQDFARGMASLHEFGLLHRDLKAANVLVMGNGTYYWSRPCHKPKRTIYCGRF